MKINESNTLPTSKSQSSRIFETARSDGNPSSGPLGARRTPGIRSTLIARRRFCRRLRAPAQPSGPPTWSGCERLFSPGSTRLTPSLK